MAYERLLSPVTIDGVTMRNRVMMGSMHTGFEDRFKDFPVLADYFAARAAGGTGLLVTGGFSPNVEGRPSPTGSMLTSRRAADKHKILTEAVHEAEGRILLQAFHTGRYAYHPWSVSASGRQSRINPFKPRALSTRGVQRTVASYARAARLAKDAGYDGVEIMGSEGYLINQFLAAAVNDRTDRYGGSASNRMRFPTEIVSAVRDAVGDQFMVMYRISLVDLIENSQTWEETQELALRLQEAGVGVFNTGIGWHESNIPTIVTSVPRGAFAWATGRLRREVEVPVVASNRINTPEVAEKILADGQADMISMARPLLADPEFVNKAAAGRADEINTCIGCNQACLDHVFDKKMVSCLVNPKVGRESTLVLQPVQPAEVMNIAVVGAGPAGLAAATSLAERGHKVTMFEANKQIGGQFRLARQIPGKEEFAETLRYFTRKLELHDVQVHLQTRVEAEDLQGFDHVVLATGVSPRKPPIPGIDHEKVIMYDELIRGEKKAGKSVAIIGAGGIGFDVAEFLLHDADQDIKEWMEYWGVTDSPTAEGGMTERVIPEPRREIFLLQRKTSRLGRGLGRTTGWVHRQIAIDGKVEFIAGASYDLIDDAGLHITVKQAPPRAIGPVTKLAKITKMPLLMIPALQGIEKRFAKVPADAPATPAPEERLLEVDSVIICAGQESVRELLPGIDPQKVTVIGGADVASELDAKRAIRQATEVAAAIGA